MTATAWMRLLPCRGYRALRGAESLPHGWRVAGLLAFAATVAAAHEALPTTAASVALGLAVLLAGAIGLHITSTASRDVVSGLLTRRAWISAARLAVAVDRLGGQPSAVVVIDLDEFKQVNDTHGHLTGDQVLRRVANTVQTAVRRDDLVGRFGGDEFAVLLPGATAATARGVAHRIRDAVAADVAHPVTVSVGVSADGDDLRTLIDEADRAVYSAKARGRNRVVA